MKKIHILLVVILCACGIIAGLALNISNQKNKQLDTSQFNSTIFTTPRLISNFKLISNHGKPFTLNNLKHHWSLVFFGFTNCGYICPTTMAALANTVKDLKNNKSKFIPKVILISVDPKRDTIKALNNYVTKFNPNFIGLRGSRSEIDNLTKQMAVLYIQKADGDIDHSGAVMLINPQGQLAGLFSMPHKPDVMAKEFELVASHYAQTHTEKNPAILDTLKNKWVVINYWADWCKPCITEMPELNKLYSNGHKYNLTVIGVNYDGASEAKMLGFAKKYNIHYPLVSQFPIAHYGIKTPTVLPSTYIINPQGKLVKTLLGPQTLAQIMSDIKHA